MVGIKEVVTMEKRIELERLGRDPAQITELNLDNCKSTSVAGLSEEWENLQSLSLSNVGLTSLKGFPRLSSLQKLELSDNLLNRGLEALTSLPKLSHLNLSGNKFSDLELLKPLKDMATLTNVDLGNCKVRQIENYREKMFAMIPSLVYLDGYDKEDNSECEEEEGDEGDEEGDEEEEEDEEEEDEDEEDVPLEALYDKNFINSSAEGDEDYEAEEEEEEDEDIEEEEEERANDADADTEVRGKKRKLECED